jgi:hypothetical protein
VVGAFGIKSGGGPPPLVGVGGGPLVGVGGAGGIFVGGFILSGGGREPVPNVCELLIADAGPLPYDDDDDDDDDDEV